MVLYNLKGKLFQNDEGQGQERGREGRRRQQNGIPNQVKHKCNAIERTSKGDKSFYKLISVVETCYFLPG